LVTLGGTISHCFYPITSPVSQSVNQRSITIVLTAEDLYRFQAFAHSNQFSLFAPRTLRAKARPATNRVRPLPVKRELRIYLYGCKASRYIKSLSGSSLRDLHGHEYGSKHDYESKHHQCDFYVPCQSFDGNFLRGLLGSPTEQAALQHPQADRERTVILAEGYAEAQSLRGEGEAFAIKIYAAALEQDPEFYAFIRRLEAYKITLKEGDSIIIPADSDFFRYLVSGAQVPAFGEEEAAGEAGE
jgi:hypothetical protein